jgi:hypothetical protein
MGKGKYKEKVRSALRTAVGSVQPSSKQQRLQQQRDDQRSGGGIHVKKHNGSASHGNNGGAVSTGTASSSQSRLSDLQQRFKKKLEGARFRSINERLYSCKGEEAFSEFQTDPSLFDAVSNYFILSCIFISVKAPF